MEAKWMASHLEAKHLEGECQQKDKELARMIGTVFTEKSLRDDVIPQSLRALEGADELRQQCDQALGEARQLRREASLMAKWSAGFYKGFDTWVKVAKDKFLNVNLTDLKAKDYTD